jgi:hypothetical protein
MHLSECRITSLYHISSRCGSTTVNSSGQKSFRSTSSTTVPLQQWDPCASQFLSESVVFLANGIQRLNGAEGTGLFCQELQMRILLGMVGQNLLLQLSEDSGVAQAATLCTAKVIRRVCFGIICCYQVSLKTQCFVRLSVSLKLRAYILKFIIIMAIEVLQLPIEVLPFILPSRYILKFIMIEVLQLPTATSALVPVRAMSTSSVLGTLKIHAIRVLMIVP